VTDDLFHEIFRDCDGKLYDDFCHRKRHICSGCGAWNHTLLNKKKYQGCAERAYFENPINKSWNCQKFHAEYGETTKYREWFKQRQIFKYGRKAVKDFFDNSPQKIKERI
jgi:hypothetical protein